MLNREEHSIGRRKNPGEGIFQSIDFLETTNPYKETNKAQETDGPWRASDMKLEGCQGYILSPNVLGGPSDNKTSLHCKSPQKPPLGTQGWCGLLYTLYHLPWREELLAE